MNAFIAKIKAWFLSKNITTHTVWIGLLGFAVAYDSSSALRDQVATLFFGHPVIVTKIGILCSNLVILSAMWAKLSHSSSPAGTVANAQVIQASQNPQTQAEVNAADTTKQ